MFGDWRLDKPDPTEIASWRITVPQSYRFKAT
jgi:hypothetical protein